MPRARWFSTPDQNLVFAPPSGPVSDSGPGGTSQASQTGRVGDPLLGDRGELLEVGREGGVVVRLGEGLLAGGADGHALGQAPIDDGCHDAADPAQRPDAAGTSGRTTLFR